MYKAISEEKGAGITGPIRGKVDKKYPLEIKS
jgi:hypothetical protein